jgi:anti-sigma regulatory factor (Ser/Thr protein kinase)
MTRAQRRLTLPAELMSVREGRYFARDALTEWGYERLADDVQLCVSELITNAVRHAGTELVLTLLVDTQLTVEVRDAVPELGAPAPQPADDPLASSGRGLHIVAAISTDWGVTRVSGGKAVWFTLPLPDVHSADADVFEMDDRRDAGTDDELERGDRDGTGSRELRARSAGTAS